MATSKLLRSQNAHARLRLMHSDTPGKKGDILFRYHDNIIKIQKAKKRVVSKNERRKIFKTVRNRIYKK